MPTLFPFGIIIQISVPYFVAVVAMIIYNNKYIKKVDNIVEDKEVEDKNENDDPQLGD
jgi:hypothetical protein